MSAFWGWIAGCGLRAEHHNTRKVSGLLPQSHHRVHRPHSRDREQVTGAAGAPRGGSRAHTASAGARVQLYALCADILNEGMGLPGRSAVDEPFRLALVLDQVRRLAEELDSSTAVAISASGRAILPTSRAILLDALPSSARFITPCAIAAKRK